MNNKKLIEEAKNKGFAKAIEGQKIENLPEKKQKFIQLAAEMAFSRIVAENINYDNDIKKSEFIEEILVATLKSISEEEEKEVCKLTLDTLNNMIELVMVNF